MLAAIHHIQDEDGKVGSLGMSFQTSDRGIRIKSVTRNAPVDKAGLKVDDIVIEADKQKVITSGSLTDILLTKKVGDTLTLKVLRGGDKKETLELTVQLGKRGELSLRLIGDGQSGIVAAYAALFEPSIKEVIVINPPKSHMEGPHFLNVLRVLDIPEALGLSLPGRSRSSAATIRRSIAPRRFIAWPGRRTS